MPQNLMQQMSMGANQPTANLPVVHGFHAENYGASRFGYISHGEAVQIRILRHIYSVSTVVLRC